MNKRKLFIIFVSVLTVLSLLSRLDAFAESRYKISYDQGLHNSYHGTEPDDFIKGSPPSSVYVDAGGSFTVAENTFTFRDYYFAGWSSTYTDASGSSTTKLFKPGQTVSDVNGDMTLKAVWAQHAKELSFSGLLYFCEADPDTVTYYDSTRFVGESVTLPEPKTKPDDSFTFAGWLCKETNSICKPGELFEIALISNTFCAVWEKDGSPVNFCAVTVSCSAGGSASFETKSVIAGQTVSVEFYPDDGYEIQSVTRNGKDAGTESAFSFTASEKEEAIAVTFKQSGKKTEPSEKTTSTENHGESKAKKYSLVIFKETTDGADGKIYINGTLFTAFGLPFDYEKGEILNISYEPDENSDISVFQSKSENTVGTVNHLGKGNPFQITVNDDITMNVRFTVKDGTDRSLKGKSLAVMILFIVALSIAISVLYIMICNNKKAKKRRKRSNYRR